MDKSPITIRKNNYRKVIHAKKEFKPITTQLQIKYSTNCTRCTRSIDFCSCFYC